MSRLSEALDAGEFVITGEVAPPRGTDLTGMRRTMGILGPVSTALNVTDNQGATLHLSSLSASRVALDMGYEPIFQQTGRDRNRLALQSDLLAAWTLGLTNVLFVTGDDPRGGDHPQAKGVFDLDATQMIAVGAGMNDGHDMLGRELVGGTGFFMGAALFPEAEPWPLQRTRAEQKVEAGARFFQTQAIFDFDKLARAADAMHAVGAKVIAGVLILRSARTIDFINRKLAGLMVPEHVAERVRTAADPLEEAVDIAVEQVRLSRAIADGVHIMPLGLDDRVPEILQRAGL
ncbi:MAG TPA: methylenetetrahydrofolate reductase [Coriobacteriia bacterium]|jgi:5,10-methylenetetrahydrofolate reductase